MSNHTLTDIFTTWCGLNMAQKYCKVRRLHKQYQEILKYYLRMAVINLRTWGLRGPCDVNCAPLSRWRLPSSILHQIRFPTCWDWYLKSCQHWGRSYTLIVYIGAPQAFTRLLAIRNRSVHYIIMGNNNNFYNAIPLTTTRVLQSAHTYREYCFTAILRIFN